MTRIFRHPSFWLASLLVLPIGCVDGSGEPELTIAENKPQYAPQQGRLLQGFETPDARTFQIAGASVVGSELTIGALTGKDVVNAPPFVAQFNGTTIDMRIAQAFPPDANEPRWQYLLEQRNAAGLWEPACDAPRQLVPSEEPFETPIRALAMPGQWLSHMYWAQPNGVTFACRTGVAAKCDGWGYSVTSQWPNQTNNGIVSNAKGYDLMQACTQMARADYCGVGAPNTLDGTPIWINDAFTAPDAPPTSFAFEAAWAGRAWGDGRPFAFTPVVCLSKLRWSTLPLGGDCPLRLPDPRVDAKGKFCDDISPTHMESAGALLYSSSTYIDAGLYTHIDPATQLHLTTANLLPAARGLPAEWQIPAPAGVPFPGLNQTVALEATIFRAALPVEIPNVTLVPLSSYRCDKDLITSTTQPSDPTCTSIAMEGWVYPPGSPGRAPLRRWFNPTTGHSRTTAISPTTMLATGWQVAEVVGGVLRAAIDVNVRWTSLPGYSYTVDAQTRAGGWITSCIDSAHIGAASEFAYRGVCVGSANFRLHHADIAAFRVTFTRPGWPTYTATQNYDGFSSDAYIALTAPGSITTALAVRWNNLGDTMKYALDVQVQGSDWIRCADQHAIGGERAYIHTGTCWSAGVAVPIRDITRLRVCALDGQTGNELGCSIPRAYNGRTPRVSLRLSP